MGTVERTEWNFRDGVDEEVKIRCPSLLFLVM